MVCEQVHPGRRRFPPRPSSVGQARAMVRELLTAAGRDDLVETAELLVSEIVTNAIVHAGTPIDVAVSFVDGGLRVEVTDGSPHVPSPRDYGPSAGTGRGLMLLEELGEDWGVLPEDPGKTVWFHIATDPGTIVAEGRPLAEPSGPGRSPGPEPVSVALLDVPLLLHEAWRQHAEALLREYLLATIDATTATDPILQHARASDAIALLAEHIPPSGVGEDPAEVMVTATEPFVSSPLVEVPVPPDSVASFRTLDETITAAAAMADAGDLLTAPTQPELRSLRAWLCGEVLAQSGGSAPTSWTAVAPAPPADAPPPTWDPAPVQRSTRGMVAADDNDRIAAVSGPALEILGYDDPADLVGRRLVELIPRRYRQAHLAGFTMHFLSGRSTLIGRTVVVPAVRRDGTEVEVEMTIRTEGAADGRTVFVAELARA
ncbi:ATP-binding protein [Nocardioides pakistanensis]